jgi:hypothetical protein
VRRWLRRIDWRFWAYFLGLGGIGVILTFLEYRAGLLDWTLDVEDDAHDDGQGTLLGYLAIVQGLLAGVVFFTRWRIRTRGSLR